ncbi:GyrI-like domain-containing protein [Bacillus alkalicellulosilyticus]|uniref:GyrI-like domain-containing protein n=1 Tax=Alkalihalobacterium alkalicellulosilyticum TaxID=1912214 RepID=UPI000997E2E1|nr:GyrI-like domain-containing protein [Bacillus alkalicellulosilyticus]
METKIIKKEPFTVIGMTLETLLSVEREQKNIQKLFDTFNKRIIEIENRLGDHAIGIFIDPPNYNPEADPFKWITGIEVSSSSIIPDGMESFEFPANTYACTTYQGGRDQAHYAYDYLYSWIIDSEYELADSYGIEIHQRQLKDDNIIMDLMFPIRKK